MKPLNKLFTKKIANLITGVGFAIVIVLIFTIIFINLI